MPNSDPLLDGQTRRLLEHSEELLARSRALTKKSEQESSQLADLYEQSKRLIETQRGEIEEIYKIKDKYLR